MCSHGMPEKLPKKRSHFMTCNLIKEIHKSLETASFRQKPITPTEPDVIDWGVGCHQRRQPALSIGGHLLDAIT